jgi:hypothetical protein
VWRTLRIRLVCNSASRGLPREAGLEGTWPRVTMINYSIVVDQSTSGDGSASQCLPREAGLEGLPPAGRLILPNELQQVVEILALPGRVSDELQEPVEGIAKYV